jgi:hypothetical protein
MSLIDFMISPPSCDGSVTEFWGWDTHEAQLCCPDEVDGDIWIWSTKMGLNLLKPTGYVMHHQFIIQQLYALPTLYLCVLYLSPNQQQLLPHVQ